MSQDQQTSITNLKSPPPREMSMADQKVDMFSLRGFELACRIAKAFAASDAVPAIFRSHNLKKVGSDEHWVENKSAIGNCIVAIETAQAVGMSVTAVMQNADVIEGKLRWSDKFVVAGINASRRFTPLRFDVKNLGPVTATYKEKTGWDNQARRPIFAERSVTLDNLQSIAWALPYGFSMPQGVYNLDQAKAIGLPVIEGAPVSMQLAVEEGWYAKAGSKWQTLLKHKMLMMRSGRFFGDIHAPDIVMGIGRTTEETVETMDFDVQPDGSYAVDLNKLRAGAAENSSTVTEVSDKSVVDTATGEVTDTPPSANEGGTQTGTVAGSAADTKPQADQQELTFAQVHDALLKSTEIDTLDVAADLIKAVPDADLRTELAEVYRARREELEKPKKPASRAARNVGNVE